MKTSIILPLLLISTVLFKAYPQNPKNGSDYCYFDQLINQKKLHHLQYQQILNAEAKIREKIGSSFAGSKKMSSHIKTIPVVVHVIHDGGTENISEAQIQSQIDVLNEDYRKIAGTNGDGFGVDTKIQFCLAKITPDGKCSNGIVRIKSSLTNHNSFERSLLKDLSFWDSERYLNIYVVKNINGGVLGYASFPGAPPEDDGIVVSHFAFGRTGTVTTPYNLGRVTSHELGHWFGLYHTFQDGCGTDTCTTGDLVCDTPPVASPNFGCPTGVNSCSNDNPNLPDQVENYMDYTDDACANMFTNGQKLRMQAALDTIRTIVWSDSNLISTGCDSGFVSPACTVIANLVTLTPDICVGDSIYFMDKSLNNAISWQWTFPGGTPDNSTLQNPTVTYDSVGTYAVTLIAGDSSAFDTIILPNYITVTNPGIGDTLPFSEDFESGIFPPSGITINNPDAGITWELDSLASTSGKYSIRINNLINTNYGSTDEIILPFFNLAPTSYPFLEFNWAYARSDPNFSDELIVLLSVDCGNTFNQIFYGSGTSLATGPTQTTPFIPDSSQWRSASISLKNYDTLAYVLIKLVNVTDGGNNLYIDDISVSGSPLVLIPDTNFRNYLRITYPSYMDLSGDSLITKAATSLKTILSCTNRNIRDLTGIEYFINIPGLFCQNNKLNSLPDLSGNTALKFLRCSNNQLTSVPNLSANNSLVTFYVENNQLDFSDAGMLRIADNMASSLFVYAPQNPFGMADTVIFSAGDTLVFSIASQDSAISYGWFFNGDTIPGATDTLLIIPDITAADIGVYTCKSYGTALLSPPMNFGPGISEFVSEPFIVIDTSATSVSDIYSDHAILKVFPNPFSDKITLEYTLERSSNIQITIYDNLGRVVKSFREENKDPGTYRIYFQPGNSYRTSSLFLVRMVAGGIEKPIEKIKIFRIPVF